MFYKIEIPNIVIKDIHDLSDYIYRLSFSKEIANKVYDNLYSAIFSLDFLPYRYEKDVWDYRRIIVDWNYKIYYKIQEEYKKVIIIRVIRSQRIEF